jgi:hypothetical protein
VLDDSRIFVFELRKHDVVVNLRNSYLKVVV